MSKRVGYPMTRPAKLIFKQEPGWVDLTDSLTEPPTPQPIDGTSLRKRLPSTGSNMRVLQIYPLNFQPLVQATISLNGVEPEVRFTGGDASYCMTGEEYLQMSTLRDDWPNEVNLFNTWIEPQFGGCRLTPTQQDFCGFEHFSLLESAVLKLKTKLDAMTTHVRRLQANEMNIRFMFDCIVKVYREEYMRSSAFGPIDQHERDLSRLVESHVSPYTIVKDFFHRTSGCQLSHYSLLSCVLAQKETLRQLFK